MTARPIASEWLCRLKQVIARLVASKRFELGDPRDLAPHEIQLLEDWYSEKVWKNEGYRESASKLYSGFGQSLLMYARLRAARNATLTISDMIYFLMSKGHTVELGYSDAYVIGVEQTLIGKAHPVELHRDTQNQVR